MCFGGKAGKNGGRARSVTGTTGMASSSSDSNSSGEGERGRGGSKVALSPDDPEAKTHEYDRALSKQLEHLPRFLLFDNFAPNLCKSLVCIP